MLSDTGRVEARRRRTIFRSFTDNLFLFWLFCCTVFVSGLALSLSVDHRFISPVNGLTSCAVSSPMSNLRCAFTGSEDVLGKSQRSLSFPTYIHLCFNRELAKCLVVFYPIGRCSSLYQRLTLSPRFCSFASSSSVPELSADLPILLAPAKRLISPPVSRHQQSLGDTSLWKLGFPVLGLTQFGPTCISFWSITMDGGPSSLPLRPRSALNFNLTIPAVFFCRCNSLFGRGLCTKAVSTKLLGLVKFSRMTLSPRLFFGIIYHSPVFVYLEGQLSSSLSSFGRRKGFNPKPPLLCSFPRYQNSSCRGHERTFKASFAFSPQLERIYSLLAVAKRGGWAFDFLAFAYNNFEILFICGMDLFCLKSDDLKSLLSSPWERPLLIFMRGVFRSIENSMKSFYLLTALPSSVMVHTGPVEATKITPVRFEVREYSKSLLMLTTLRSVEFYGLKCGSISSMLDIDILNTSPDGLSSFIKLVSLSLLFACTSFLSVYVCFSGLSDYASDHVPI